MMKADAASPPARPGFRAVTRARGTLAVMDAIWQWLGDHTGWLVVAAIGSVVVFALSIVVTPMLVARLPADYFAHDTRPPGTLDRLPPAWRWTLTVGKNLLGALLLIAGLAMLVLPGQGLLTMFAGAMLIDLPGKYRVECWLVRRRPIARSLNWLRRRRNREPLVTSTDQPGASS